MTFHPWQFLLVTIAGWMNRQQQEVIQYLRVENQILREKLGPKRLILNESQKRCSATAMSYNASMPQAISVSRCL